MERLEQYARVLAQEHKTVVTRKGRAELLPRLEDNGRKLIAASTRKPRDPGEPRRQAAPVRHVPAADADSVADRLDAYAARIVAAGDITNEAGNTANHANRLAWASAVLDSVGSGRIAIPGRDDRAFGRLGSDARPHEAALERHPGHDDKSKAETWLVRT